MVSINMFNEDVAGLTQSETCLLWNAYTAYTEK